jgi:Cys-tRNA(Pro)/Cys-tRNA(Cys) deacylase
MRQNNVTRLLETRKIPFIVYELPNEKLGAIEAAQHIGAPPDQVFKTIVITREDKGKPILAVVPGTKEVDLKALAQFLGEKKIHLPTERDAERLTGLQAGGISPLALINRGFEVVIDTGANKYQEIYISGGQRGLDIRLQVQQLVQLVNAKIGSISKPLHI